ncbi:hypothetical protein A5637_18650 [Mycolicibacterium fortuitum]|uniref:hypothetical protein n=1 Tax=Mycolicibacterium fortuitum TaxID=1766 RepID=UPI0007EE0114|nr:hypothetical protein [Mycolicibacterium fortuitum]OBK01717.1 hypothetical protein A5637_18650 [Mycolicibacterium fortuitum]
MTTTTNTTVSRFTFRTISEDVTETVPFQVNVEIERDPSGAVPWIDVNGGDLMVPAGARALGAALIAAADQAEMRVRMEAHWHIKLKDDLTPEEVASVYRAYCEDVGTV